MEPDLCYIGRLITQECHLDHYTNSKMFKKLSDLSETELSDLRSKFNDFELENLEESICEHHYLKYIVYYTSRQDKCCDPFKNHTKTITKVLRCLNFQHYDNCNKLIGTAIKYGSKVCCNCATKILSLANNEKEASSQNDDLLKNQGNDIFNQDPSEPSSTEQEQFSSSGSYSSHPQARLNKMLESFDEPPLKKGKLTDKRFTNLTTSVLVNMNKKFIKTVNKVFDVEIPLAGSIDNKYFQELICNIQSALNRESKINEKISILTLLPSSWSYQETIKHFHCTRYMYVKSRTLRSEKGVLAKIDRKKYTIHSPEVRESIVDYYKDDTNSKLCSGTKECISVTIGNTKEKQIVQKRLLLYDLRDMYNNWIKTTTCTVNPSFSIFASLRPRECVLAGSSGTHTVCVCCQHQNVKLKLSCFNKNLYYRDILDESVCSTEEEDCMVHKCQQCPGVEKMKDILQSNSDEKKSEIKYPNWVNKMDSLSMMTLDNFSEPVKTFIDNLSLELWNLTEHHFVSEKQKEYLRFCKTNLDDDTCIILMDFAENFTFVCQESIQAFYFSSSQATLHPIVIYYRQNEELKTISTCIISDSLKHNAYAVNIFQEHALQFLKDKCSWITKAIYFSDGAPTQYKNKHNFINLCYHESDFTIKLVSYNFFATSHGKSVCDGIGAIAKRAVRKASLQRSASEQILSPKQMFDYLDENVKGIKFMWVPEKDVEARNRKLIKRFSSAKTIKDTRKNHCFIPIDKSTMKVKLTSESNEFKIFKF